MLTIDSVYHCTLLLTLIAGLLRYRRFDKGAKIIFFLMVAATLNELIVSLLKDKQIENAVIIAYHSYCIVEFSFITTFFLMTIGQLKMTVYFVAIIILLLIGILNYRFLQHDEISLSSRWHYIPYIKLLLMTP